MVFLFSFFLFFKYDFFGGENYSNLHYKNNIFQNTLKVFYEKTRKFFWGEGWESLCTFSEFLDFQILEVATVFFSLPFDVLIKMAHCQKKKTFEVGRHPFN
jgi:hypothetical protein